MALLGPDGRPVRKADLTEEIAAPSITGVRSIISGHPAQGLTPERLARILREAEAGDPVAYLELAEEMEEKDGHYAGTLGVRKRAVRGLEMEIEAAGPGAAEEEAAQLAREVLEGDGVRDDLLDVLDALGKGYSVTEIVWATDGPRWTVGRLEWRDPRWFRPSLVDGRTMRLLDVGGELDLPPYRFVTHLPRVKSGIPVRGGLARLAAWAYLFKSFAIKDWAIFAEAYGHPIRLGKYGPDATEQDRAALLRALRAIGTDMAAAIPASMMIELVHAQGAAASAELYETMARWWDEQISKAVLGQVGTTDALKGGYAVGKVHDGVREDIRDADAEQLAATLRRDLLAPLTAFNFGPAIGVPKLKFLSRPYIEPAQLSTALTQLVPMGLRARAAEVRARLGLTEPEPEDEVLTAPAPPPAPAAPEDAGPPRVETAAERHGPTEIDLLVERLIEEEYAPDAAAPMMGPIGRALVEAASLEELRERLRELADRAPPERLVSLLARARLAAGLAGLTGAPIGPDDGPEA